MQLIVATANGAARHYPAPQPLPCAATSSCLDLEQDEVVPMDQLGLVDVAQYRFDLAARLP
jgi:hypothetical protein